MPRVQKPRRQTRPSAKARANDPAIATTAAAAAAAALSSLSPQVEDSQPPPPTSPITILDSQPTPSSSQTSSQTLIELRRQLTAQREVEEERQIRQELSSLQANSQGNDGSRPPLTSAQSGFQAFHHYEEAWRAKLADHPDQLYVKTLADIIIFGAKVGYCGPEQFILSENLTSANEAPEVLLKDLEEQRHCNRLTPIEPLPAKFISSPLGLVPKADGRWRRIHHLSHPKGKSVNCHIPTDWGSLEYATFDQAVEALLLQGPNAILVKKDLADAFRHIPVASSDHWLLEFQCGGRYWVDRFLPFGLRTSPYLFDLFAKGLCWILIEGLGWRLIMLEQNANAAF